MSNTTIGIIGGMGPRATVEFEQRLVAQFQATDQDIPTILAINDGSIPDRTKFLLGRGASPAPKLRSHAQTLQDLGASVLCMPCNTAHAEAILGQFVSELAVPLLDMPALTLQAAVERGAQTALVLCTAGTKASGVFDARTKGTIMCIYPDSPSQYFIGQVIKTVKSGNSLSRLQKRRFRNLVVNSSCDVVILACTELSLLQNETRGLPVIDTLDVLATECAKFVISSEAIS